MLVTHYIMISLRSFLKPCCAYLFDFVSRRTVYLKVYQNIVATHCASQSLIPQDLLGHIHVSMVSFLRSLHCCCSISAYSFHYYLSL